ncbi:MAG: hypothetical protein ISQ46_03875 [Methylophilaceae bacterium]|nr:hypothetical protein [Methylophilaceae bacterium]
MQSKMLRRGYTNFCVICQNNVCAASTCITLNCNHVFHWKCLMKYAFQTKRECPCCRQYISMADMIRLSLISRERRSKLCVFIVHSETRFVMIKKTDQNKFN